MMGLCNVCALYTVCLLLLNLTGLVYCTTRTYYIGIQEVNWNYAPNGTSSVYELDFTNKLASGPGCIGRVYKKAVYKQYTDQSFSTEVPKHEWLGFLGPVIRAEVDDVIVVHLKNFASRQYSLHPHGVFYEKDSEGALYPDGTSGKEKKDDAVQPNETYIYRWNVTPEFAPTDSDSSCQTWIYHSHVDAPHDIASGLIGALLTCKKGTLDSSGVRRSDVDRDFFLMFSVVDENLSWYLDDNIKRFCPKADKLDEDFQQSNLLHAINGFIHGNLPLLELCVGKTTAWNLFSVGNEVDIHSVYFHGHTLLDRGHRTDVLSVFPATSVTATMVPRTLGRWLLGCQVNDHIYGMLGFYQVSKCNAEAAPTEPPVHVRRYYIAAEEMLWDYAPGGMNLFTNHPLNESESDSEEFFSIKDGKLGGKYTKVRYVQYTDDTFTTLVEQHGSEEHLGILGPVIRAGTGDLIEVTFKNKASRAFSMQPHGLSYDKVYEGANYRDGTKKNGSSVFAGHTFIYRWRVTDGPSSSDPPCLSYLYYSATNPVRDTNSGLVGPIQVCKKGVLDESGRQHTGSEVQKEFFLLFTVMDENESWYLEENIKKFGNEKSHREDQRFQESNKMRSVNGYMYGNLPALDLCEGDHVVWHMLGLGNEVDIHGVYFQGNTFQRDGTRQDTLNLFPHTSVTVCMEPDNDGTFELSCLTTDHHQGGMRQYYTVKKCKADQDPGADTTTFKPDVVYYLAAVEVDWNYAANRTWELERHRSTLTESPGDVFLNESEDRIGPEYKKVVYREYTDKTFTTEKRRGSEEEHLCILGPIIRVQVGENVQVVFKNKATKPYSVHAHGVKSSKAQPVQPGEEMSYNWTVSAGPGPSDPNCITYVYYSSVNYIKDLASGLVGPLVVCRKGTLNKSRQREDVKREFALLFMVFDENESWYLDENIERYLHKDPVTLVNDEEFVESNMMHGINGRLYANLPGLTMNTGDRTEWYLIGLGNEFDMHTVHFHANSFIYKTDRSHRADVFGLFPGTFKTVELKAGTPGTWLLHCHVFDHIHAGMETTFTISGASASSGRSFGDKNGSSVLVFHQTLVFITAMLLNLMV